MSSNTIRDVYHNEPVQVRESYSRLDRTLRSSTIIGIEVEVERADNRRGNPNTTMWATTEDSSLRNVGAEFISNPHPAAVSPALLSNLFGALGDGCSFNQRTSVHVHVNQQDRTGQQVQTTVALYMVLEPLLYRWIGRQRYNNIYCVPLGEIPNVTKRVMSRGGQSWLTDHGNTGRWWPKYTGLNLAPLAGHGTIEFRQMSGCNDAERITKWVDIITHLTDQTVYQNIHDLATDSHHELSRKLLSIFGSDLARELRVDDLPALGVGQANLLEAMIPQMDTREITASYLKNETFSIHGDRAIRDFFNSYTGRQRVEQEVNEASEDEGEF
jgi:hypothetical protein